MGKLSATIDNFKIYEMARLTKADIAEREQKQKALVIEDSEYYKALKLQHETKIKSEVAELERLKKEKLLGSLVLVSDVESTFIEISSKVRSQLYRLVSQLPPRLEGLEGVAMTDIIRESIDEILKFLSDSFQYKEPEKPVDIYAPEVEQGEDSE